MNSKNLNDINELEDLFDNVRLENISDIILISIYYLTKIKKLYGASIQDILKIFDSMNFKKPSNIHVYIKRLQNRNLITFENNLTRLDKEGRDKIKQIFSDSKLVIKPPIIDTQPKIITPLSKVETEVKSYNKYEPFLKIKDELLPDSFYVGLKNQINKSYNCEVYPAVFILCRKFLENLIIGILSKKYGMSNIDLFYNEDIGRHHNFNELIKNFKTKINDFKPYIPSLDNAFIKKIEKFRQHGNASAHTIELNIKKNDLDKEYPEFEFTINILLKLFSLI